MTVFLVVLLGLGVASSSNLGNPTGLHFNVDGEYATSFEDYKPRDYKFEYGVSDPHTGDHKSHWELRENGVVRGEYSLLEPDGTTRVVQYTADDHGFRAVVKKIGYAVHATYDHQDLHRSPIIIPEVPSVSMVEPYFKTFDGKAENYIDTIDDSNIALLLKNNHQISEQPELNSHIQKSTVTQYSIADGEVNNHNYQLPLIAGVGGIVEDQQKYNDHLISIHQEPVHVAEPIYHHESIHTMRPIQQQPVYSYEYPHPQEQHIVSSSHIQEPLQISGPSLIQEPIYKQEHINSISSSKELPTITGLKVEHPHGESSSSFIGSTGNPDDDSAYTRHDKGLLIAGGRDYSGWNAHQSPIPYQRLKERDVDEIEKLGQVKS